MLKTTVLSLFLSLFVAFSALASSYDYPRIFDLTYRVMKQKDLYKALNDSLPQQKNSITQSQLVYVLQNNPEYMDLLETALQNLSISSSSEAEYKKYLTHLKGELKNIIQTPRFIEELTSFADPSQSMTLSLPGGQPGYRAMKLYVNHPHLEDPDDLNSRVLPGDDLRQLVVDFIKGSEQEIWYNVFDFDLQVIAEALREQHLKRGVKVTGGIDAGTIKMRPEVQAIFNDLSNITSSDFNTVAVNSVGLNHQKILLRDPFGPRAAVLFLSGNFTQSCIGPEGDLVMLPKEKRPLYSIPNANHALLIMGALPAQLTQFELKKTLEYKIRGQSQYPVGGSFKIFGADKTGDRPYVVISFSPNGGMGDVNGSIYAPLIRQTKGSIEAVHFAFSSKQIQSALLEKADRDASEGHAFDFKSVGDTPFAMREWSVFLKMSGLMKDLSSNKFVLDPDPVFFKALSYEDVKERQNSIRVAPGIYGDRYFKDEDGKSYHVTSKIHHKVFIFPQDDIAVLGTSFNPSENAESNNEQIVIVHDKNIVKNARGFFSYLFKESKDSVAQEAQRRNKRIFVPTEESSTEDSERGN